MKANELRIGNYYNQFGNIHQASWNTIGELEHAPVDQLWCKPIKLTEEWHNKFGCTQNGFDSFEYTLPRKNNMRVKVIFTGDYVMLRQGKGNHEDDVVVIWNKDVTRRDMYVHEWQNLYYTLTREELTLIEKP